MERDTRKQFSQFDMDMATKLLHAEIERLKSETKNVISSRDLPRGGLSGAGDLASASPVDSMTNRTSNHGHDPAFDDLIADGGLPEARRVEDEMFRIAAQNATDANARLARTAAQRDELLTALKALVEDYELLLGDGITDRTRPRC